MPAPKRRSIALETAGPAAPAAAQAQRQQQQQQPCGDAPAACSSLQHQVGSGLTSAAISAVAAARDPGTSAPAGASSDGDPASNSSSGSGLDITTLAAAVAASKLGLLDQLGGALEAQGPGVAAARDCDGRSCLHYAAGYGHEACVDLLLGRGADPEAADGNGGAPRGSCWPAGLGGGGLWPAGPPLPFPCPLGLPALSWLAEQAADGP
jgi:hypothetical protein